MPTSPRQSPPPSSHSPGQMALSVSEDPNHLDTRHPAGPGRAVPPTPSTRVTSYGGRDGSRRPITCPNFITLSTQHEESTAGAYLPARAPYQHTTVHSPYGDKLGQTRSPAMHLAARWADWTRDSGANLDHDDSQRVVPPPHEYPPYDRKREQPLCTFEGGGGQGGGTRGRRRQQTLERHGGEGGTTLDSTRTRRTDAPGTKPSQRRAIHCRPRDKHDAQATRQVQSRAEQSRARPSRAERSRAEQTVHTPNTLRTYTSILHRSPLRCPPDPNPQGRRLSTTTSIRVPLHACPPPNTHNTAHTREATRRLD